MNTGRGVRVAVVDSGVHAAHPHVNGVAGGAGFDLDGRVHPDFVDRLGHGTAVTAAIRDQAPDAELYALRVFDRALATSISALVAAIDWAAAERIDLINLSLGTPKREHEPALREAVARASAAGTLVVAARQDEGVPYLPGSLPGVIPVEVDWTLERRRFEVVDVDGVSVVRASGLPREIPGVPPARNLHGVSFAVSNATGFVACALEGVEKRSAEDVLRVLSNLHRGGRGGHGGET